MLQLPAAQKINRSTDVVLLLAAAVSVAHAPGELRLASVMFALSLGLWLLASRVVRQYDAENGRGFVGDLVLTMVMLLAIVGPMSLLQALSPSLHAMPLGRLAVNMTLLFTIARLALVGRLLWKDAPSGVVVLVGIGALGRLTGKAIQGPDDRRRVLGYLRFDDQVANSRLNAPLLGAATELGSVLNDRAVDEVYFASTSPEHALEIQRAVQACEKLGVPFALPACSFRLGRAKPAENTAADGYVHYRSVQGRPLELWVKRLIDIAASATALVVLSPLLVLAALLVKLTSKGPVLFGQARVGMHGRDFKMLKFRSMVANAEALKAGLVAKNERSGPAFKIKHDPRVTAVGRFIRKYSIDELPQLVNVLRGDMSIVGPRPPLASEVLRYEGWQRRRLSVRPGLTCVWQVSGRDGISFEDWMLLDMLYIDHWSLAQDFALILKTVPVVVMGRGAS